MSSTENIVNLWGGASALGRQVCSERDFIPLLREGLPYAVLERTMEAFSLSRDEVANVLDLPRRTLTRRKQEQRLAADESDRLYRMARVMAHAEQVLGSRERAAEWFHRPNRALAGEPPLGLLDTDIGVAEVDDVIGRLEHGVFS